MTEPTDQHRDKARREDDGGWYYIKWYDVDLSAYPQEPKFAIEDSETLLAVALEEATAKRIITAVKTLARDAEIREVLDRLQKLPTQAGLPCWCRLNWQDGGHDGPCRATRALYAKLQPDLRVENPDPKVRE